MAVGWGIVGIGQIADRSFAPAIGPAGGELISVWSRDAGRAEAFARRHGARRATTDLDELVRDPDVQAVYVATPNALHLEPTVKAARAGKHVLCEKPLALAAADAWTMVKTCQACGVRLGTGFQTRHHPASREIRRLLADGAIGQVVLARAEYGAASRPTFVTPWRADPALAGAGTLMNLAVHAVDLLRYLLGQEVVEVAAMTDASPPERPLDSEVSALLRFADGTRGIVHANQRSAYTRNDLAIYGAAGRIWAEAIFRANVPDARRPLHVVTGEGEQATPIDGSGVFRDQIVAFHQAIATGEQPSASGLDGLRVVEVADALLRSARDGRLVRI